MNQLGLTQVTSSVDQEAGVRYTVGLIYNWPGEKNSELDLIGRCVALMKKRGCTPVVLSPLGHELTLDGKPRDETKTIDPDSLDFCIHLHYTVPNALDTFAYFANWNPLGYLFRDPITGVHDSPDVHEYRNFCLRSYDCFLSSGSPQIDQFAKALQANGAEISVPANPTFYPTAQEVDDLEFPDLQSPKIFYIGLNWERILGVKRHGSLLRHLDDSNDVYFYGVEVLGGMKVWSGFNNYKGEIPFDRGETLYREANRLGVSLVLSSNAHARDGVVSTRIFQACAAKTVIISDDNRFVVRFFGDSVLTFPRTLDAKSKSGRILEHLEWIRKHPEEARGMARRAHDIFLRHFTLQAQIELLLDQHESLRADFSGRYTSNSSDTKVDVILFHSDPHWRDRMNEACKQEEVQVKPFLIISPDASLEEVSAELKEFEACVKPVRLLSNDEPLGSVIVRLLDEHFEGNMFAVHRSPSSWQRRHLSMLARKVEDGAPIAQSTTLLVSDECRAVRRDFMPCFLGTQDYYNTLLSEDVLRDFKAFHFLPSSFLFARSAAKDLGDRVFVLNGLDHGSCLGLVLLNYLSEGVLPTRLRKPTNLVRANGCDLFDPYRDSVVPHHGEIGALLAAGVGEGFIRFSRNCDRGALLPQLMVLNGHIRHCLRKHSVLTAMYNMTCRLGVRVLGIFWRRKGE